MGRTLRRRLGEVGGVKSNSQLLSLYVPGTVTAFSNAVMLVISSNTPGGGHHSDDSHLAHEEKKAQRGEVTSSGPHS